MTQPTEQSTRQSFFRMLVWPSALGLGTLAAFLFSIKKINPQVEFEINAWSWIILVVATLGAWFLTRNLFQTFVEDDDQPSDASASPGMSQAAKNRKRKMIVFCVVLLSGIFGSLAYSLKDIPESKRFDVIIGISTALIFVGFALYGFWRLVQFLENHGEAELKRQAEEDRATKQSRENWRDSEEDH